MSECPPCNNHCNQGRTCPSMETRETTREEKITTAGLYEVAIGRIRRINEALNREYGIEGRIRNETLEEVAKRFDAMPFGDTAASFAKYVRDMKT